MCVFVFLHVCVCVCVPVNCPLFAAENELISALGGNLIVPPECAVAQNLWSCLRETFNHCGNVNCALAKRLGLYMNAWCRAVGVVHHGQHTGVRIGKMISH